MKTYGITNQKVSVDKIDLHQENLRIKGFSIESNLLDAPNKLMNYLKQVLTRFNL